MFKKNTVYLPFNSQKELDSNAVKFIVQRAELSIKNSGSFKIVLSGGTTPVSVYKLLAKEEISFEKWHVYFGDERCFSLSHPERNSYVAQSIWLSKVDIPKSNIYVIPAELGNEDAANEYEKILNTNKTFDLVILGLGDDGHVASLFPNHQWSNSKQVVPIINSPKPPSNRVSLTPSRLSNTKEVLFLIAGKNKLEAFKQFKDGENLPANLISARDKITIMTFNII